MSRAFIPAALAALVLGCGGDPVPAGDIGSLVQPIVGGDVDTTHGAVVTIYLASSAQGQASCTGTIVGVNAAERIGYVLTAAHCVAGFEPFQILEGGDNAHPDVVYRPLTYAHDPGWNPPQHDFAIIRAVGMDEQTPVIRMIGPGDALEVGDDVLALGFGATLGRGLPDADTSRHSLPMKIVAETAETFTLSGFGDTCEGDSGGPILAGEGTAERVVGVNSTGDASCFLTADAARLTSGLADFVQPYLDAPLPESCLRCRFTLFAGRGECVDESARCEANRDCVAVRACLSACDTDACNEACIDAAGPGVALYFTRQHCWCDPCAARCAEEPVCTKLSSLEKRRPSVAGTAGGGVPGGDSVAKAEEDSGCATMRFRRRDKPLPWPVAAALVAATVRRRRRAWNRSI